MKVSRRYWHTGDLAYEVCALDGHENPKPVLSTVQIRGAGGAVSIAGYYLESPSGRPSGRTVASQYV